MLLILCGKTASGKNTYREKLLQRNTSWHRSISHTTRPMRDGEQNHFQYHFIETTQFLLMTIQNFFIEITDYKFSDYFEEKWYYGLSKHEVYNDAINLAILNQDGVKKAIENFGKSNVKIVYLYSDNEELRRRGHQRLDDSVRFEMRLRDDEKQFQKIEEIADLIINTNCSDEQHELNYKLIENLLEVNNV
jgi:guanylate kinase